MSRSSLADANVETFLPHWSVSLPALKPSTYLVTSIFITMFDLYPSEDVSVRVSPKRAMQTPSQSATVFLVWSSPSLAAVER